MKTFCRAYQCIVPGLALVVAILVYCEPAYAPNRRITPSDPCANYTLPGNFAITVTDAIVSGVRTFKGCLQNAGAKMPSMYVSANLQFVPIVGSSSCFNLIRSSPFAAKETFHFSIRLHENNAHGCFGKYELTIDNPPVPAQPCPGGGNADPFGACKCEHSWQTWDHAAWKCTPAEQICADDDAGCDTIEDCDEGFSYDEDLKECVEDEVDDPLTCLPTEILINGTCYANTVKKPITPPAFFPPIIPPATSQHADTGGESGCSLIVRP